MSKKPTQPSKAGPSKGAPARSTPAKDAPVEARPAQAEPDDTDLALIQTAEELLGDHFFDPDAEDEYKRKHQANRGGRQETTLLRDETLEVLLQDCAIRIEGLRTWTRMRVTLRHPEFSAVIEGMWSFDNQELRKPDVVQRTGDADLIEAGLEEITDHLSDGISDEELMAQMGLNGEEEEEDTLIGDDPREPPPATGADRSRLKAIAKRLARSGLEEISFEDQSWLEQTPQALPILAGTVIEMAAKTDPDDPLLDANLALLGMQLEFVRYRQDRGWAWADAMLKEFQEQMLAFGREGGSTAAFMAMGTALTRARVPVSEPMREALAQAGLGQEEMEPSGELDAVMDTVLAQLADAVDSPFDVTASLAQTGAVLPAALRGFLATKLAQSAHQVVRDAAALLLLDEDTSVRAAAARALAAAESISAETLRRAVTIRNWVPEAERADIDAVVRKAREAGVAIASWPEHLADTEFHASMVDGSAAQSILMVSRQGKKFVFGALLIRHGEGVLDAWEDPDLSRTRVQRMLREAQQAGPSIQVSRGFVDLVVQHAIGTSAARGVVPPESLLQMAEDIGAADWKARQLAMRDEIERRFSALGVDPAGHEAMEDAAAWLAETEMLGSWFEEGPGVHGILSKLPRNRRQALVDAVLGQVLPEKREDWAEKFLLMALWCEAAEKAVYRDKAPAMLTVAHALVAGEAMAEIPAMRVIAEQTVTHELVTPW